MLNCESRVVSASFASPMTLVVLRLLNLWPDFWLKNQKYFELVFCLLCTLCCQFSLSLLLEMLALYSVLCAVSFPYLVYTCMQFILLPIQNLCTLLIYLLLFCGAPCFYFIHFYFQKNGTKTLKFKLNLDITKLKCHQVSL